ncbi:hypothetical protein QJS66_13780 [Kocuria rhizophila]|nr:hypothetical protein QJS66_13780 [Kocuria rhizophila]
MNFCVATAVLQMELTVDEAIRAATLGGAKALRRGRLHPAGPPWATSRWATRGPPRVDAPQAVHLAYRPGMPSRGRVVAAAGRSAAGGPAVFRGASESGTMRATSPQTLPESPPPTIHPSRGCEMSTLQEPARTNRADVLRFVLDSAIGIFMFFVPVTIGGKSTIPLDHIVTWLRENVAAAVPYYALAVNSGRHRCSCSSRVPAGLPVKTVFAFLTLGLVVGCARRSRGPHWLMAKDMGPFLFNSR